MFLGCFLIVGGICFFFLDIDISSGDKRAAVSESQSFSDYVLKDDFTVRSILSRIASQCSYGNSECVAVKAFSYISNDIILSDKGYKGKHPTKTLSKKEGDVADKAVLLASFLENAGIKTVIDHKNNRLLVYAAGLDVLKLYNEILKDMREHPLASRSTVLNRGGMWAVNVSTKNNQPISVDILATASGKFNMFLFPDESEMKAHLKNKDGRYFTDCYQHNVSEVEQTCISPSGGRLLFVSVEDNNSFSSKVFSGGLILSDIKSISSDDGVLVPMDVALDFNMAYPGILSYK